MPIDESFNRSADYYDDWVRKGIPCYDEVFATAVELIPFDPRDDIRILDLGAGTGLFTWHVMQQYTNASFVLYDISARMLDVARERFRESRDQVSIVQADYLGLDAIDTYDVIVSSLSIHHLAHADKRKLFSRAYRALKATGALINIDQIDPPTQNLKNLYWETWLEKVRSAGAGEERIQESIRRRRELDQDASLSDQLNWLTDAGFVDVDCIYKHYFVGIFYGLRRPAGETVA